MDHLHGLSYAMHGTVSHVSPPTRLTTCLTNLPPLCKQVPRTRFCWTAGNTSTQQAHMHLQVSLSLGISLVPRVML